MHLWILGKSIGLVNAVLADTILIPLYIIFILYIIISMFMTELAITTKKIVGKVGVIR